LLIDWAEAGNAGYWLLQASGRLQITAFVVTCSRYA